jgi:hypothetical protein
MEKEFIPYEQSLALKELGFDEPCFRFQNNISNIIEEKSWLNWNEVEQFVSFPLYQQAFRWFREKYGLRIRNYGSINYSGGLSEYFEIFKYGYGTSNKSLSIEIGALTYEEAELACLIKLIEIVKNK